MLESGSGAAAALTNDEKKLLASINSMKRSLAAQNDERAGQNEHKRAEEQLAAMLSQASAESATVMHSRAAVASAEAEASEMVEKAQQRRLESMKVAEESRTVLSKAGLALNPGTPVEAAAPLLDLCDLVCVMTVNPGFGGQKFIRTQVEQITKLRKMIGDRPVHIEVDGGVDPNTAPMVVEAGADVLVAGSAVFKGGSVSDPAPYGENIRAIRASLAGRA